MNKIIRLLAAITILFLNGAYAMAKDITLKWEWPADRTIEQTILVKVDKIEARPSGVLKIKMSPSIAANIPEPTLITGTVLDDNNLTTGKSLSVVVPRIEIENLSVGTLAVIGVVESNICICITPLDSETTDLPSATCHEMTKKSKNITQYRNSKKPRSIEEAARAAAQRFRDNAPKDIEEPEALASGDMKKFLENPDEYEKDDDNE